mmetsp:Transcript_31692/g.71051  ORF Transcript_31692/g.71051 Transcript_31692/m.71051 type:complete len:339 (+) Transcript_31692:88-1104(+)
MATRLVAVTVSLSQAAFLCDPGVDQPCPHPYICHNEECTADADHAECETGHRHVCYSPDDVAATKSTGAAVGRFFSSIGSSIGSGMKSAGEGFVAVVTSPLFWAVLAALLLFGGCYFAWKTGKFKDLCTTCPPWKRDKVVTPEDAGLVARKVKVGCWPFSEEKYVYDDDDEEQRDDQSESRRLLQSEDSGWSCMNWAGGGGAEYVEPAVAERQPVSQTPAPDGPRRARTPPQEVPANAPGRVTPDERLEIAVKHGDIDGARRALGAGADPNREFNDEITVQEEVVKPATKKSFFSFRKKHQATEYEMVTKKVRHSAIWAAEARRDQNMIALLQTYANQ